MEEKKRKSKKKKKGQRKGKGDMIPHFLVQNDAKVSQ